MPEIEYGKDEWTTDTDAANAEAQRRAILTRDAEDPAEREAIWFSDLGALTMLPTELAEIEGLQRLIVGYAETPDGSYHASSQQITDMAVLADLPGLTDLNLADTGITTLAPLAGMAALRTLDISRTQVADLAPLVGLAALQSLDIRNTKVADLAPLAGMTALQTLDISGTPVADLAPLAGLAALLSLDISRTQVSDLAPLAGLAALRFLDITRTQVADLAPLLALPRFAAREGEYLYFAGTPAARQDRRWEMLAGLGADRAAIDVPLYLKGEHPDLQPPSEGGAEARGVAGMAAGSPVRIAQHDGMAELEDRGAFHPPVPVAQQALSLGDLRGALPPLLAELEEAGNVPPALLRRVQGYAVVCAEDAPVFATLEGSMVMIRPLVADPYVCDGMDSGLVTALERLVALHDALGVEKAVPEVLPALPTVPEDATQGAAVAQAMRDLSEVVRDGAQAGLIGVTVVHAVNSTVEVTTAANAPLPPDAGPAEEHQRKGLWSWVLRMGGGIAEGLQTYGKIYNFAKTPAGVALLKKLDEIVEALKGFF